MDLDHQRCYDAMRSRDPRFDGRFWIGVRTTGVYCRPVCPSRLPLARNVEFFGHPAAAEDAGFRPCRRCRPETAPGTAGWRGGAAVVDRALRLIDEGALDGGSVPELAARLHVGDRHLRRLFVEHVGTSPDAVARSRRAHLAHRLLVETDLPVSSVAFAAGFGSLRQCNDVVRATFAAPPSELRGRRRPATVGRGPTEPDAGLRLRLVARAPFDGTALLAWFRDRAVAGVEVVGSDSYRRRVVVDDKVVTVTLTPVTDGVTLDVHPHVGVRLGSVVGSVRRLFDLSADPDAVADHLGSDPLLGPSVRTHPGLRVPGTWTGFEAVVRAVVGQQISVRAAVTILGRIAADQGRAGTFPGPEELIDAPMTGTGLLARRADTLRRVADGVLSGAVVLDGTVDRDELIDSLVAIDGIGAWTAEYVALRIGEPDAFPAADLHLMRVLGATTDAQARARAEAWRPWRSYAAAHLWNLPRPERLRTIEEART